VATVVGYRTHVVISSRPGKWLLLLVKLWIFQGITAVQKRLIQ